MYANENAPDGSWLQELILKRAEVPAETGRLYYHVKRPQWGPATLIGVEMTRRAYQFRDGRVRKLKEGFYHLMQPFEATPIAAEAIQEELEEMNEAFAAERRAREALLRRPPVMSFDEQLRVLRDLYPGGFEGSAWRETWRAGAKRSSKRHADRALRAAAEQLSPDALRALDAGGDHLEATARLLRVLRLTSLARPSKEVRPLAGLPEEDRRALGEALCALICGGAPLEERLSDWIAAADADGSVEVTWQMATLPLALVQPEAHVLVDRRTFQLQAVILGRSGVGPRPSPRRYGRAKKLAVAVHERLVEAGEAPADLLDAALFTRQTLRPSGQARLRELGRRRAA